MVRRIIRFKLFVPCMSSCCSVLTAHSFESCPRPRCQLSECHTLQALQNSRISKFLQVRHMSSRSLLPPRCQSPCAAGVKGNFSRLSSKDTNSQTFIMATSKTISN
ncbi:hypothetical protein DFH28DRAFT_326937 [Melampsora americana]|nr:hypothetical protein DFH28DRAFT_378865 [Melampsora americana]KAH9813878.1 hypothetical protein DFH28DRAFT_326937 [Melampsora americana]